MLPPYVQCRGGGRHGKPRYICRWTGKQLPRSRPALKILLPEAKGDDPISLPITSGQLVRAKGNVFEQSTNRSINHTEFASGMSAGARRAFMTQKTADEALERLREIRAEFSAFCDANGAVTEADTRAQLIDKILVEV